MKNLLLYAGSMCRVCFVFILNRWFLVCSSFKIPELPGTIMTISKDRVKPSPLPDSWKLAEIFTTGVILGGYLAMMTVIFFWAAYRTDFFPVRKFTFVLSCHQNPVLCMLMMIDVM